ncbi:aminoacyl-tRNA hydrolase [Pseudenhygromyxa sp. WMMC2535]|uniref:aminoacyl-tRNA hydrolase n=1 Tax=Pseudenhygromyxa sp. WMMC2535 TaxID=2712867 RepID=UPI0015564E47|nr:aminoacyl-tRNA hydrolase [Pseudenhygromyxa sp. WMMC2535]NVB38942.1 aminoacyl-tRNA hydrolase [Pseudenhygromyxa sp. WMMC2535]
MSDDSPWLIVGLGNPGPKYAENRHNVGFMVVERWVELHQTPGAGPVAWRSQFKAQVASTRLTGLGRCLVIEPQTYMNCSGESVRAAMDYHDVPLDRVVVVHDEIDFEFGRVGLKRGGGHGGHNGLRDIIKHLGKPSFLRVRVGVGRPRHGEVADWVLANFSGEDAMFVGELVDRAAQALTCLLTEGLPSAMNKFHQPSDSSPATRAPKGSS